MSEPYLPVPGPEPDSNWDPEPARCPECGTIIDPRPAPSGWEGRCPEHGMVTPVYPNSIQISELTYEEERDDDQ